MAVSATVESAFAPLLGQMAWQARSDEHGCIMLEFGAPHLEVREPMKVSAGASAKVRRLQARRVVSVTGDWHLWIESCIWTLRTGSGAISSGDPTENCWQDWMDEISGQRLASVHADMPGALTLAFDMGAVLEVSADPDGELQSWSLFAWKGPVTTCSATGQIELKPVSGT